MRTSPAKKTTFNELQNKKLDKFYVIIHVVTVKMPIKRDTGISNVNIYILYGISLNGSKKIIGIYEENIQDNRFWLETLEYIKARDLEKILFVSMESNKKLEQAFKIMYNNVQIVPSAVKIISSISSYTNQKWQSETEKDILKVFLADNVEESDKVMLDIKEKHNDNKIAVMLLDRYSENIRKYYKYEKSFRHLFCSYFTIKIMKGNIVRLNNIKDIFESIESIFNRLLDYYTVFENTKSYTKKEWVLILNDIYVKFSAEVEEYIV